MIIKKKRDCDFGIICDMRLIISAFCDAECTTQNACQFNHVQLCKIIRKSRFSLLYINIYVYMYENMEMYIW